MKIIVAYQGKTSKNIFDEAESKFIKRIKKYARFEFLPITPLKLSSSLSIEEIRNKEEVHFKSKLPNNAILILLDESGKLYDSKNFAGMVNNLISYNNKDLCFVIGGAYGFSKNMKSSADHLISLSKLTFAHHLARIVFLEQLYRAFTIINGEPYHNT